MSKRYWNGNIRLISDFFWCSIIIFALSIFGTNSSTNNLARFLGAIVGCFFSFFFWSWNKSHVKSRFARFAINLLFFTNISFLIISVLFCIYINLYFFDAIVLALDIQVAFWLVTSYFSVKKYRKIMSNREDIAQEKPLNYVDAVRLLKTSNSIEYLDEKFSELIKDWPQFESISSQEYKLKKSELLK